MILKNSQ